MRPAALQNAAAVAGKMAPREIAAANRSAVKVPSTGDTELRRMGGMDTVDGNSCCQKLLLMPETSSSTAVRGRPITMLMAPIYSTYMMGIPGGKNIGRQYNRFQVLRQLGKNLGLREYIMQQTRAQSNFFY
jgi:hypothetical protein